MNIQTDIRPELIVYDRSPETYRHWLLKVEGRVATLAMKVDEEGGLKPGYRLKLNSYDLGVDMELADAVQRIRFEHPEVGCIVLTSAWPRIFCSGANIYMLGLSTHAWKVNFCKFTNETRNGFEDTSWNGGPKFLAAVNGACAGGGYELALACDEIVLIDDKSSSVALPEIPLLAVLPGTGGLTRVVDKRKVRRDLADIFCTIEEGVRGKRAKDQGFVDEVVQPAKFEEYVKTRAGELAEQSERPKKAEGVKLTPVKREIGPNSYHYQSVRAEIDRARRFVTITLRAPDSTPPKDADAIRAQGADFWPLAFTRELDDLILMLRTNDPEIGLWVFETEGDADKIFAYDAVLDAHAKDWFVRETTSYMRRTFARLETSSRSMYAIVRPGSCFAGTFAEFLLAADRSYMLDLLSEPEKGPKIALSSRNFGAYPTVGGVSRIANRFFGNPEQVGKLQSMTGKQLPTAEASELGLITAMPDDLDWDEEIRLAIDTRASLSPDALTGMEASLRFAGAETLWTKVFGRLSAWQNWIFIRPNAVGDGRGALKLFGTGKRASFDWNRV
jgi:benzoyl-CoA-dihydrodiol lyase